jgi:hypothetical protein
MQNIIRIPAKNNSDLFGAIKASVQLKSPVEVSRGNLLNSDSLDDRRGIRSR